MRRKRTAIKSVNSEISEYFFELVFSHGKRSIKHHITQQSVVKQPFVDISVIKKKISNKENKTMKFVY